jgi:gentisate 1,2-dioxygenase
MSIVETKAPPPPTAEEEAQIKQLYADFERHHLMPLWTQTNDLMPFSPQPAGETFG